MTPAMPAESTHSSACSNSQKEAVAGGTFDIIYQNAPVICSHCKVLQSDRPHSFFRLSISLYPPLSLGTRRRWKPPSCCSILKGFTNSAMSVEFKLGSVTQSIQPLRTKRQKLYTILFLYRDVILQTTWEKQLIHRLLLVKSVPEKQMQAY